MTEKTTTRPSLEFRDERKQHFIRILSAFVRARAVDLDAAVLIVGASLADLRALRRVGFHNIFLSNIRREDLKSPETPSVISDVEALAVAREACDIVVAVEVLHHCRSPHQVLCEMVRVSSKYVIFLEPNESLLMRLLVKLRLSFPYEMQAAIAKPGRGGLMNSGVPNFIYRWNEHEAWKTVSSFIPEFNFEIESYPYWDLTITEGGLLLRPETKLGAITKTIGSHNFIRVLKGGERMLNRVPPARRQGNKFCCIISKSHELQRWLKHDGDRVVFARERYR